MTQIDPTSAYWAAGLSSPEQLAAIRDPERLAALHGYSLLDTLPEASFDRLTRLAAEVLGAPLALINLVDDRRQFAKSCFAPPTWGGEREAPLDESFCKWTVVTRQPVVIEDARRDARVSETDTVSRLGLLSYAGVPLVTADGKVLGALCTGDFQPRAWSERDVRVLEDLAASVLTEIELRVDILRRREVERIKDEFVGIVSHELRTPLTSIRGSLGLLASGRLGDLSPQGARMVAIAAQNVDRLVRIVNDMLDLERLESGRVELERREVPARELVDSVLEGLQELASPSGVRLRASVPEDLRLWVDPDCVVQVLTNLLSNAVKFSPAGADVEVRAEHRGKEALFQVRDRGRGIPESMLDSIFERFRQVDSSDARKKGGTGLGLPICRSIVLQHGGRIWASSEVDRGSTFFFTLPTAG